MQSAFFIIFTSKELALMASFLYYSFEVNVMNLINGIIITFISKLEWGTVADWVSGIGSFGAVIVALWQIIMQRKKEEKDKILANRPFFSFMKLSYLTKHKDHLWTLIEDASSQKIGNTFKNNSEYEFKNGIHAYEFKNVSQAVATNVALKVEYQNKLTGNVIRTDYCNIETCVMGNERAIILPHSTMSDPSYFSLCPKRVNLYFSTIDDRVYRQRWIERIDKFNKMNIVLVDIMEVPKEEMPHGGACSCGDIN